MKIQKLMIFVGPPGAGKTARAYILKKKIELNYHLKVKTIRTGAHVKMVKLFIEPTIKFAFSSRKPNLIKNLMKRLLLFYLYLYEISLMMDLLKLKLLNSLNRADCIIEHEGLFYKWLVDLFFLLLTYDISNHEKNYVAKKATLFLLHLLYYLAQRYTIISYAIFPRFDVVLNRLKIREGSKISYTYYRSWCLTFRFITNIINICKIVPPITIYVLNDECLVQS